MLKTFYDPKHKTWEKVIMVKNNALGMLFGKFSLWSQKLWQCNPGLRENLGFHATQILSINVSYQT